ncbi:MAG: DUF4834 family protein [Bacteroidota bacterium]
MALLKTVLIILLVYYLLKMLGRLLAPKLFSYAAKKTEKHFRERFGQYAEQNSQNEDQMGDVIINKSTANKSNPSKKVGEYIDFEEIE